MAKTYSVSVPDSEARQLDIEAKKLSITVPELIRRKMKSEHHHIAPGAGVSKSEFDLLWREVLIISAATRVKLEDAKNIEFDAKVRGLVKNGIQELERVRKEAM